MTRAKITVEVRRLPSGGWRLSKFYPKAKGSKTWGWVHNDGPDLRALVHLALRGLEHQLVIRAAARPAPIPKASQPADQVNLGKAQP